MSAWHLSWRGLRTVVELEIKQRVRSKRWLVAIIAWFALIGGVTLLMMNMAGQINNEATSIDCSVGAADGTQICTSSDYTESLPVITVGDEGNETTVMRDEPVELCTIAGGKVSCRSDLPDGVSCTNHADGTASCVVAGRGDQAQLSGTCTINTYGAVDCSYNKLAGWSPTAGPLVFSVVMMFVLGLGLLVTPALTATSINGDRHNSTLATLQATKLSAAEIALGKLLSAWLTMLAFLLAAAPWLGVGLFLGGVTVVQTLAAAGVMMLIFAVVAAICLGWSALVNRTSGSSLLGYGTVAFLSFMTLIIMALSAPLVTRPGEVQVWSLPDDVAARYEQATQEYWAENPDGSNPPIPDGNCVWETHTTDYMHTEDVWWLASVNPFVILADSIPLSPVQKEYSDLYRSASGDLLYELRVGMAQLSVRWDAYQDDCSHYFPEGKQEFVAPQREYSDQMGDTGRLGLIILTVVGVGFFVITVRRLRVPYGVLPKGMRVA